MLLNEKFCKEVSYTMLLHTKYKFSKKKNDMALLVDIFLKDTDIFLKGTSCCISVSADDVM